MANIKWKLRKKHKPAPDTEYRNLLYWLYDGKCAYCGKKVKKDFHADHIKAYYHGGHTTINNMCVSCPSCNKRKGTDNWIPNEPNAVKKAIAYMLYLRLFKLEHLI